MSPRLNLLVLVTRDLVELKNFYEAIGLVFIEERHGAGPTHYASVFENGLVLEIYPEGHRRAESNVVRLGFEVEDLPAVLVAIGKYTERMTQLSDTHVVVRDLDNRPVEITERKK